MVRQLIKNQTSFYKSRLPRIPPRIWVLAILTTLVGGAWVEADGPHQVALIVQHDETVITKCVEFSESEITGLGVLERSGLDLNYSGDDAMGATICRIDGEGCTYPAEDCFCQCENIGGPEPCNYWSYWRWENGEWRYSGVGASGQEVKHGDVEGWSWGEGEAPPVVSFSEVCVSPATDTPTPTDTPTFTPTATKTPPPTDSPTPAPTPVIHDFSASQAAIRPGETVQLNWDLDGARTVYLRFNGIEEPVVAPGNKTVAPDSTTIYTLVARNGENSQAVAELTIVVDATAPAPTLPTSPTPVQKAVTTPLPPTATPAPEPIISFGAASLTVPDGACTSLKWDVKNATTVYLNEQEVSLSGSQSVCPSQTQTYLLQVLSAVGEREVQLTLKVVEPITVPIETVDSPATVPSRPTPTPVPAVATPVAAAIDSSSDQSRAFTPEVQRRFTIDRQDRANSSHAWSRFFVYGGVAFVVVLFLVVPVVMLVAGWAVWWQRGRK